MSSRRPYGAGSLLRRGDSWYGQWRVEGRFVKRKLGPVKGPARPDGLTKREAEQELRVLITETSQAPATGPLLLGPLAREHLDDLEHVRSRKASTLEDYRIMLRRHLLPFFGDLDLRALDAAAVIRYGRAKRREGLAPKTIANHLVLLQGICTCAVRTGRLDRNPVQRRDFPRAAPTSVERALSMDEVDRLIAALPDERFREVDSAFILTSTMAGLRLGEARALTWPDVDLQHALLHVRRSFSRGRLTTPKSERSHRSVPIPPRLQAVLREHRARTPFAADSDFVFAHPELGSRLDDSALRKRFNKARAAVGLPDHHRLHDLRHTYGSLVVSAGVPLIALKGWMGHESITTTLIYARYAPDPSANAAAFGRAFGEPPASSPTRPKRARQPVGPAQLGLFEHPNEETTDD